ncbi:MAG: hypothetical protein AB1458_04590 [Bacteroidota bacterium]
METNENVVVKKSTNAFKNVMLALLGVTVLGLGYVAFRQNKDLKYMKAVHGEELEKTGAMSRAFDAIQKNLEDLGLMNNVPGQDYEGIKDPEARIMAQIDALEAALDKNKKMIDELTAKVGEKDANLKKFKQTIAVLEKRVNDYKTRTTELTALTDSLQTDLQLSKELGANLTLQLESKAAESDEKSKFIEQQNAVLQQKEAELRTGYFTVGSFKDLKEKNVVDKKGGIVGLASAKTLKSDFNREEFTKIDIFNYTSIPVFSKDAKLVTNHSSDSYELVRDESGKVQWIQITDPQKFWESSKYLVVLTK